MTADSVEERLARFRVFKATPQTYESTRVFLQTLIDDDCFGPDPPLGERWNMLESCLWILDHTERIKLLCAMKENTLDLPSYSHVKPEESIIDLLVTGQIPPDQLNAYARRLKAITGHLK